MRSDRWFVMAIALATPLASLAQSVISAKSGLIHTASGEVYVGDSRIKTSADGKFTFVPEQATLRTGEGRAEIFLTPGVFLRTGAHSSFRLDSSRLNDTRLELLSGRHALEVVTLEDGHAVSITMGAYTVPLRRSGVYYFNADEGLLRVYRGKLEVSAAGREITLKRGQFVNSSSGLRASKFDPDEEVDALLSWSMKRSQYIAMANLTAARALWRDGLYGSGGGGWVWNPYLGLATYMPLSGIYGSPFGWSFYSPRTVYVVYAPRIPEAPSGWVGGMGTGGSAPVSAVPRSAGGAYGPAPSVSSSAGATAGVAAAPSPRGGADASPRGGAGGGGR